MSDTKTFGIGPILSVAGGHLLCDIGDVYAILNWMTEDNLFTHQLPRAMRECRPWLLRWFPELKDARAGITRGDWREVLASETCRFGATRDVPRIPKDDHTRRDPVTELENMVGKDRVIVVEADGFEGGNA